MSKRTAAGRDGFWANTAPPSESLDWVVAVTPFGWSASVTLFGREWVVGRMRKMLVVINPIDEESI